MMTTAKERDDETRREKWHQAAVSWGGMLITVLLGVGSAAGTIVYDRLTNENRITKIEKDIAHLQKYTEQDFQEMAALRTSIDRKLDNINSSLNGIEKTLIRHQTATDLYEQQELNGKVRIPRIKP